MQSSCLKHEPKTNNDNNNNGSSKGDLEMRWREEGELKESIYS